MDPGERDHRPSRRALANFTQQRSGTRIAVIGGDGIGPEVIEAAIRVL
jgi:hypothetical protein